MSQQGTPEDDTAPENYLAPGVDDTEGHLTMADKQPSVIAADEQPGVKSKQHDGDDAEGHMMSWDKAAYRVQDDEDDAAGPGVVHV